MSGYVAVVVWPSGDDACNLLVEWLSWIQALLKRIIEESADADVGDALPSLKSASWNWRGIFSWGLGVAESLA
jgi:hypothetical protein